MTIMTAITHAYKAAVNALNVDVMLESATAGWDAKDWHVSVTVNQVPREPLAPNVVKLRELKPQRLYPIELVYRSDYQIHHRRDCDGVAVNYGAATDTHELFDEVREVIAEINTAIQDAREV